ncbi:MAG: GNAT family N-acetyltransferase [Proteobacteria bacterium]|nr:GNAT family N-acetyltransferase [Pseudomonadota bacterium]
MPKYFRIRKMDIVDVPAVAALVKEFSLYMHALGETSDLKLDAESLERDGFGTEPAFQGIVAEESPLISGFLLYHSGYDTDAACRLVFVVDLFVTKRAQGQGIGFALMTEAKAIALAQGAKQLVWTIDRRNVQAERFYEGIGAKHADALNIMYLDV